MAPRAGGLSRHAACSSGSHGWWLVTPRRLLLWVAWLVVGHATPPLRLWLLVLVASPVTPRRLLLWVAWLVAAPVTPRRRSAYGSACWWLASPRRLLLWVAWLVAGFATPPLRLWLRVLVAFARGLRPLAAAGAAFFEFSPDEDFVNYGVECIV